MDVPDGVRLMSSATSGELTPVISMEKGTDHVQPVRFWQSVEASVRIVKGKRESVTEACEYLRSLRGERVMEKIRS